MPPNTQFAIEVDDEDGYPMIISRNCWTRRDNILRIAVPNEKPEIIQICGYFNALFGQSVKLFGELREPVIEQFEPADRIDLKLREAMGQAEGQINRLKMLKRAMYGRAGPELMRARMLPLNHSN